MPDTSSSPPSELVQALRDLRKQAPVADDQVARNVNLTFCFDGGGGAIEVGTHVYLNVDFPCRVSGWFLIADTAGTSTFDVNVGAFTDFPTLASLTGAGATPGTAAARSGSGSVELGDLDGWTLTIARGSVLEAVVAANDTIGVVTLSLRAKRLDL